MTLLDRAALDAVLDAELEEQLVVTPLLDRGQQVGEGSIDLRLDTGFIIFRRSLTGGIDPQDATPASISETREEITIQFGQGLWIHPQEMVLGATLEFIRLPHSLGAYVLGRSTWARMGLLVATAIQVHPGFAGSLTLELVNTSNSPLKVYPGLRVAQLAVHRTGPEAVAIGESEEPAADGGPRSDHKPPDTAFAPGQYQGSTGAQGAKLAWTDEEFQRVEELGRQLDTGIEFQPRKSKLAANDR